MNIFHFEHLQAIGNAYAQDLSDEFILPTAIDGYEGMKDGDGLFMANFRSDRAREIMTVLADTLGSPLVPSPLAHNLSGHLGSSSVEEKNQHVSDNEFPELVQYISDATKKSGDDGRMKIISNPLMYICYIRISF